MTTTRAGAQPWPEIEAYIEAFELDARSGCAEIRRHLPDRSHPRYLDVLCELVRIELEFGWESGQPRTLGQYRALYPELFAEPNYAELIAFEQSRLERQARGESSFSLEAAFAGDSSSSNGYTGSAPGASLDAFSRGASVLDAPVGEDGASDLVGSFSSWTSSGHVAEMLRDFEKSEPAAASKLARVVSSLPALGSNFLGFHLTAELGRGAFGRVYLARQGDLANRPVALKVAADLVSESQTLAQLQHTNIVPIYSIHRAGPLQAVCMPYFGRTTLADLLAELRSHEGLPDSAEGLLSTLDSRLAEAISGPSSGPRSAPSAHAASNEMARQVPAAGEPSAALRAMLRKLNYGEGVLWLGTRLAEGLAHAHERGILHRDLKPANILFADDGQPMLLDFNLAADTKLRGSPAGALLGGTLPYMAPEQIEALAGKSRTVDARSDLYALGIILFELLGRKHPFPSQPGPAAEILPRMLAERLATPPRLRPLKGSITPAVESIVTRCLQPEPDRRYGSARELLEDLQCQLGHRRLKHAPDPSPRERVGKWVRRHPRLCSSFSVAVLALILLMAVVAGFSLRLRHMNRLEATESLHKLEANLASAHFLLATPDRLEAERDEGLALCAREAERYGVLASGDWKRAKLFTSLSADSRPRLLADLGELLMLWARAESWRGQVMWPGSQDSSAVRKALDLNEAARACFAPGLGPRALWQQRAKLERLAGNSAAAEQAECTAATIPATSAQDQCWLVASQVDNGRLKAALDILKTASRENPHEATVWLLLGHCYSGLAKPVEAEQCYSMGLALDPRMPWGYFQRGYLRLQQKNYAQADEDFSKELQARPGLVEARFNRALARIGLKDGAGAIADLDRLLAHEHAPTRVYFMRARAKMLLDDPAGARADLAEGLKRKPSDEASWIARGVHRLPRDPQGALDDFEAALQLNPSSRQALENKASVLSEKLGRSDEAIAVLDRAVALHPEYVPARAGRGVLLARASKRAQAVADAEAVLEINQEPLAQYQVACIYALTSRQEEADRARALRLLAAAFRSDPSWIKISATDRDLDPLRQDSPFRALVQSASALEREAGRTESPAR